VIISPDRVPGLMVTWWVFYALPYAAVTTNDAGHQHELLTREALSLGLDERSSRLSGRF
jgi:hypothetical protein